MSNDQASRVGWRIRSGADRRFRAGHPWVYSNELASSPKGISPGDTVELQDAGGRFLALGYGNPHSLIAFRALTRNGEVADPFSTEFILSSLMKASLLREGAGLAGFSHRLCFGEGDGIPGLIIDRYFLGNKLSATAQVFVVQAHSAGADRIAKKIEDVLAKFTEKSPAVSWAQTGIVLRNDLGVRKLEGLEEEAPKLLKEIGGAKLDLTRALIRIRSASKPSEALVFETDLFTGQKTGFFLDQAANVELGVRLASQFFRGRTIRILDLCCYVGQWGSQLASAFAAAGHASEVTFVDASQAALDRAKANGERSGAKASIFKGDVLTDLPELGKTGFDLVVCDPPALIKGRKDIPQGKHAYLTLNTQALKLVRPGGMIISCSCSALLEEETLVEVLAKAAERNQVDVKWISRGSQATDHPMRAEFPEGRYLKAWFGIVGER
jgi:23S rRNA (cytosine1962-C5)-methyltransferase